MNVEQPHQRLPLDGGERASGQHVCQLFCGVHISNGNGTVEIGSLKKRHQNQHGEFVTRVFNWNLDLS